MKRKNQNSNTLIQYKIDNYSEKKLWTSGTAMLVFVCPVYFIWPHILVNIIPPYVHSCYTLGKEPVHVSSIIGDHQGPVFQSGAVELVCRPEWCPVSREGPSCWMQRRPESELWIWSKQQVIGSKVAAAGAWWVKTSEDKTGRSLLDEL